MLVIGITGPRASGKNLAAEWLGKTYGCRVLDYTEDVLAPLLQKEGKAVTRENLSALSTGLRERQGNDVLTRMLAQRIGAGRYVISGIRFPEEVAYLRQRFGRHFLLVAVSASARNRYERAKKRGTRGEGSLSEQAFRTMDRLPTERRIRAVMREAAVSLTNNGSAAAFLRRLDARIRPLIGGTG